MLVCFRQAAGREFPAMKLLGGCIKLCCLLLEALICCCFLYGWIACGIDFETWNLVLDCMRAGLQLCKCSNLTFVCLTDIEM